MIVIVDYGIGNLRSVQHKLAKAKVPTVISGNAADIEQADKLILPGVGAFSAGMAYLNATGLVPLLNRKVLEDKTPVLGICLGMELFATRSQEGGQEIAGLGWIDGEVLRFEFDESQRHLRIPHVGWNTLLPQKEDHLLLRGIEADKRFYFTHSYHLQCSSARDVVTYTHYGYDFPSIIQHENIYGVQFHPEKSHRRGIDIVVNFAEVA